MRVRRVWRFYARLDIYMYTYTYVHSHKEMQATVPLGSYQTAERGKSQDKILALVKTPYEGIIQVLYGIVIANLLGSI